MIQLLDWTLAHWVWTLVLLGALTMCSAILLEEFAGVMKAIFRH